MTTPVNNAAYLRALRARAAAEGMCVECRCRPQKLGRRSCAVCLTAHSERRKAYKAVGLCECGRRTARHLAECAKCRSRERERSRRQAAERKAAGLCSLCDERPSPGFAQCDFHRLKNTERMRRQIERWIAAGKCRKCGGERESEFRMCDHCRRYENERNRAYRSAA